MVTSHEENLPTPALVIDAQKVEANLAWAAEYCRRHRINLRPHAKTHKSLYFARRQLEHGAIGLTAAKVGEAEVFADVVDDLLIAYPALDEPRATRTAKLAQRKTVRVAIDSTLAADNLSAAASRAGATLGILVDLDVGYHRTGMPTPAAAGDLARYVSRRPALRFDGFMFHPAHIMDRPENQAAACREISNWLAELMELIARDGLQASIVSGGGTGNFFSMHLIPQVNETRPGNYIFGDRNFADAGWWPLERCAATILTTVISDAVPGKCVLDAGSKTLTSDRHLLDPNGGGHGYIVEFPDAQITRLSEEHAEVDLSRCSSRPKLGQRVHVIPNHICPCVNLQDEMWLRQSDGSVTSIRVDARGKLS